jgi:hypothetical protein
LAGVVVIVVAKSRDGGGAAFPVTITVAAVDAAAVVSRSPAGCCVDASTSCSLDCRLRLSTRNLCLSMPRRLLFAVALLIASSSSSSSFSAAAAAAAAVLLTLSTSIRSCTHLASSALLDSAASLSLLLSAGHHPTDSASSTL